MRTRVRTLFVILAAAALLCAALPAVASADSYRTSGRQASAWYDQSMPGGGFRWVNVWGGSLVEASRSGGARPSKALNQGFGLDIWDDLPGDPADPNDDIQRDIFVWVTPYDMGIDRELTTARVVGTYPATVYTYVGQPPADPETPWEPVETQTTVTVDLTWSGYGGLAREIGSWKTFADDVRWINHDRRTYRNALVAGSIEAPEFGITVNGADMWADISNVSSGSVTFMEWDF